MSCEGMYCERSSRVVVCRMESIATPTPLAEGSIRTPSSAIPPAPMRNPAGALGNAHRTVDRARHLADAATARGEQMGFSARHWSIDEG